MAIDWNLVTPIVLNSLNLDKFFSEASRQECFSFSEQITLALRNEAAWTQDQLNALRFVGATLTMRLQYGSVGDPFGPKFVMDGQRSTVASDFPREKIEALAQWVLSQKNAEFRARMLDLIWVIAKSYPAAQGAISAYIEAADILEDPKEWTSFADRLERALRLAVSLGRGGAILRATVLGKLEATVNKYQGTDPLFLTFRLVSLLLEFKYGDIATFAKYTRIAAEQANSRKNYWAAKDYFELAARCHDKLGEVDAHGEALRLSAEALVSEAELASSQQDGGRGAMAGAFIMAQAYNAMRQAPKGKGRAEDIHARLLKLQEQSLPELKELSTTVNIQELIDKAVAKTSDKPLHEALIVLCKVNNAPPIEKLMEKVRNEARTAILSSMFSSDVINSRGRVVAKTPPLAVAEEDIENDGLRFRLFRHARTDRDLVIQAFINPMRSIIFNEHNPDRSDILNYIQHSPWIPPGHVESIIRVLIAGFQGDMLIVAHMIPPQIEALIRHIIELNGGDTSMFNAEGLQPEKSLNVLLKMDEAQKVFGINGVIELEDIFVDQLGSNLRNEVAHGLISDGQMFSSDVLYAWWLLLKFCVLSSKWQAEQTTKTNIKPTIP
ncbi:DUF4209 domain-containing protein [Undibacterium sp. Ji50W]|uniref:DUF4209 domain-containing protein n=1 Tax=Undibacterium sp. Ji50W TaxID=3413041 RepID=UPI003BF07227